VGQTGPRAGRRRRPEEEEESLGERESVRESLSFIRNHSP